MSYFGKMSWSQDLSALSCTYSILCFIFNFSFSFCLRFMFYFYFFILNITFFDNFYIRTFRLFLTMLFRISFHRYYCSTGCIIWRFTKMLTLGFPLIFAFCCRFVPFIFAWTFNNTFRFFLFVRSCTGMFISPNRMSC